MTVMTNPSAEKNRWRWPLSRQFNQLLSRILPKGLYARAILIITLPLVLLQSVILFVFMERHWDQVTRRLSAATARDVAAIIEIYQQYPQDADFQKLIHIARDHMAISFQVLPKGDLPQVVEKPFFSLLDNTLSRELGQRLDRPYWLDTVGQSKFVEIRVKLKNEILKFLVHRNHTYASNSHIFLVWMIGTSIVLLTVALLFLRNQIKPILRLSEEAERFGKGRPGLPNFRPRGAREVRQASQAFIEMRDRIERHVGQRTALLAGVSHDLRTILTRLKLQLALLGGHPEVEAMHSDVNEMQNMLEDYMAFAKGDSGEQTSKIDVTKLLQEIHDQCKISFDNISLNLTRKTIDLPLRRNSFKRAVNNLVTNAMRFSDQIEITASRGRKWVTITIDDNGPGIGAEQRDEVFQPFTRLDEARNQDQGNTGLGLSIARDIVHGHGGEIVLEDSPLGGLRANIRIPI